MTLTDPGTSEKFAVASSPVDDDAALVERLRAGHEDAFVELVQKYQPRLLRLAETTVASQAVAQEVTQDTWLAVVRGVDRFEGRSSFKTWLFHILLNRARSAVRREQRAGVPDETVDERFVKDGAWANPPENSNMPLSSTRVILRRFIRSRSATIFSYAIRKRIWWWTLR